jgi:hypothetical protein
MRWILQQNVQLQGAVPSPYESPRSHEQAALLSQGRQPVKQEKTQDKNRGYPRYGISLWATEMLI